MGSRIVEFLGGEKLKLPLLAILQPLENHSEKYISNGVITTVSVVAFYENFIRGKVYPSLRTEPLPKAVDGPVTIVVGRNFEEIVYDQRKDVFVLLHAPWCKHSKLVYPVWDALAEHLKPIKNLVIVKMDATANEVDGLYPTGIPYILFYPTINKTTPIPFKGERSFDGLISWLQKRITVDHDPALMLKREPKGAVKSQRQLPSSQDFDKQSDGEAERRIPLGMPPIEMPQTSSPGVSPNIPMRMVSQNVPVKTGPSDARRGESANRVKGSQPNSYKIMNDVSRKVLDEL